MKFLYGTDFYYVDVTDTIAKNCVVGDQVVLPLDARLFHDHIYGFVKHIKIVEDNGTETVIPGGTAWSRDLKDCPFDFTPWVHPRSLPPVFKYRLAVACMFKDSVFYLKEFLAFHKAVGVEHFYLCDNNSTDDYMSILAPYIARGEVTLSKTSGVAPRLWEFERDVHMPFFNRIINETRTSVEWLACLDSDEFMVPEKHNNILEILKQYPDHASVQIRWQMYGTSNVGQVADNELLIEQLVYKLPTDAELNQSYKTICRPLCSWFNDSPHRIECTPGWKKETLAVDQLRLNHYTMGDEHYFKTVKLPFYLKVCGPSKGLTDRLETNAFNDVKDDVIYRFLPQVRQILQENSPPKHRMKFLYGTDFYCIDVTQKVSQNCVEDSHIVLPLTDSDRAAVFGDPVVGILKHIKIVTNANPDTTVPSGCRWCKLLDTVTFDL
jgi:hypothetical protein